MEIIQEQKLTIIFGRETKIRHFFHHLGAGGTGPSTQWQKRLGILNMAYKQPCL